MSIHGDLSPLEAMAGIREGLSGRWFAGEAAGPMTILGTTKAISITALAKPRNVTSVGTQVFKGRLIGEGTGCVLVGSMRTGIFGRAMVYLLVGLGSLGAVDAWGLVVWHGIRGDLTLSMIVLALIMTGVPLLFFCLYAGAVAYSASHAAYLRAWLSDCLTAGAPDGRAAVLGDPGT